MRILTKPIILFGFIAFSAFVLPSFLNEGPANPHFKFPYKQAGLTERQAAAHLLNRFTFGAKPGDIDAVLKTGAEQWFLQQLEGSLPDDSVTSLVASYDVSKMSNAEISSTYPKGAIIKRMAVQDGIIPKDSVNVNKNDAVLRAKMYEYMQSKGIKPQQELFKQFVNQKIYRAAYSNNQLHEVLTDFWFNHFNVSLTKNQCAEFTPAYERDVIRPNVTGKFENLVLATAKSPAMLMYLDNATSSGTNSSTLEQRDKLERLRAKMKPNDPRKAELLKKIQQSKKSQGLNENYAREVMELHTLGVDGGYTQSDVTQAARVLTGWTVKPMGKYLSGNNRAADYAKERLAKAGVTQDGDFLFVPFRHDDGEKTVLGRKFPAGGGYEEGVDLLKMLAHHPSAAKFISKKLAVRFVSDNPPQSLIDKMAKSFLQNDGDIKQVLITMASAPEFWGKDALREKTKSPFELAMSAVRGLDATITQPYALYTWITKMGQQVYYYQAPTGFPDRGQYWINSGSLLNRMNFGLALASQRIPGVKINLKALNSNHEPESAEAALKTYSQLIMPERNLEETIKRLTPMLNDPNIDKKIGAAAEKAAPAKPANMNEDSMLEKGYAKAGSPKKAGKNDKAFASAQTAYGNNSMLAQVVGIIIGSPEYQRK
ncbi:MAG: hypothetical protein K0S09_2142 [Sphingobacteriaceae bacterium]|jgi:uncharacterized protein (DUF1800 family)|nr:hypothetical protein [Sphingobacteriaceae bacterium]